MKPTLLLNVQDQNSGGADQTVMLQLPPGIFIEWIDMCLAISPTAINAQAYMATIQISRRATYYVLGGAGQGQNTDVIVQDRVQIYVAAGALMLGPNATRKFCPVQFRTSPREKLYLHTTGCNNASAVASVTVAYRM